MSSKAIEAATETAIVPSPARLNILLLAAGGQKYDVCVQSSGIVREIFEFL